MTQTHFPVVTNYMNNTSYTNYYASTIKGKTVSNFTIVNGHGSAATQLTHNTWISIGT